MKHITFPTFSGIRCLMMPYIQGEPDSVPPEYRAGYDSIFESVFLEKGEIGFLTIDESRAEKGRPHRGDRSKWGRALHTEVGRIPGERYQWGGGGWGGGRKVTLDRDTRIMLANSIDDSCAIWNVEHEDTSEDGDIGYAASLYPYESAVMLKAGEVHTIGILTPHESLPITQAQNRQFLRIIGKGVHGREEYFTVNRLGISA